MSISKQTAFDHQTMFPDQMSTLVETDPDFIEIFDHFAFDEVIQHSTIDESTRLISIIAALIGCQGIDEFRVMLSEALDQGIPPEAIKEIVYQSTAYCGIGRVLPFLKAANEQLTARGIALPLPSQSTTTPETRLASGIQAQVDIFGETMRDFWQSGPEDSRHINHWLAANCFGDYYTRKGLTYQQRELITFCFLAAQGGCEPQLTSHAAANIRLGSSKSFLIEVISQCLPYIGYPRSLNALRCINEAALIQQ